MASTACAWCESSTFRLVFSLSSLFLFFHLSHHSFISFLLFLLSTQESIHRLLKSYKKAGEEKEVSFNWLIEYYTKSLEKYFDGNQSFGRADDFLDDLLLTPPSLKTIDGNMGFIDPLLIVEDIIRVREEVASEWKDLVSLAPLEHEGLRQEIFVKQMSNKCQHRIRM